MMTQHPSSWIAKWKYSGALPLLLLALLVFSFRSKESSTRFPVTTNSTSEISLDANNVPPGTVHVTVGGKMLKENEDYTIDYKNGRIKILNPDYLQPNTPINVSFEDDSLFNFNKEVMPGLRDNTEQPIFPGCEKLNLMEIADCSQKKLFEYIADHLKYPEELKAAKVEGKVYIGFVITSNGYVAEVKVNRSLHPSADKAALDVVNSMNENVGKWTPGTKEGKPVNMEMVLPISFVLGITKNEQGTTALELGNKENEPYTYVERMPQFPDGQEAMYTFINSSIQYPETAKKNGISGHVIVQFVVSKDGEIQNAKVIRGIGGGCNEEALRVVNSMPKWSPGIHEGRNVPVTFTLPIKFVL